MLLYLLASVTGGIRKSPLTLNILPAKKDFFWSRKERPHDGWFPAEEDYLTSHISLSAFG